jgi:hypothetical protein
MTSDDNRPKLPTPEAMRRALRPFAQLAAGFERAMRSPAMADLGRQLRASIKTNPDDRVWRGLAADFSAIKRGAVVAVPRELLLDHGLVEPTEQERAQAERGAAEAEQRRAEHAAKLAVGREQLAGIVEEPARTILDLHCEERGECQGCDFGGYEGEPPDWPCTTVVTVARHYGIDLPEPT